MSGALLLDAALALGALGFAAAVVLAASARAAVGAFIGLGALAALIWARLGAPDVALAEAAVGAGLSGALLLRHLALDGRTGGDGR